MKTLLCALWLMSSLVVSAQQTLRLTYPNGSEQLVAGTIVEIRWEGILPQDTVVLEYSIDGGKIWELISDKAIGLRYLWHTPNKISNDCLIRINSSVRQNVSWARAGNSGKRTNDVVTAIAVDGKSNTYVYGIINSTELDLGNGIVLPGPSTGIDLFLAKYNSEGLILWAKKIVSGEIGTDIFRGTSIKIDSRNKVYISGFFNSSVDFGNGVSINKSTANFLDLDTFIAKYDENGNAQWAKKIGGGNSDIISAISLDNKDNIYAAGTFESGSLDLGSATILTNESMKNGSVMRTDGFLIKYNSGGNLLWAKSFGGLDEETVYSMTTDVFNQIYICGYYTSDIILENGTSLLHTTRGRTGFLIKYNDNGELILGKKAGESTDDLLSVITTDRSGNIYVSGEFYAASSMDFDKGIILNNSEGSRFVAKYDKNANILWAKLSPYTAGLVHDNKGSLYGCGDIENSADFGNGVSLTGNRWTGFISKYTDEGETIWAKSIIGPNYSWASSIDRDLLGNIYVGGTHHGVSLDFNNDIVLSGLTKGVFTAKYAIDTTIDESDASDAFFSIISPGKNFVYIPDVAAYTGERTDIKIKLQEGSSIAIAQQKPTAFKATIAYHNSILAPYKKISNTAVLKGMEIDTLNIIRADWNGSSIDLATIPFTATLGDRTETPLELLWFEWLNDAGLAINYDTELQSGTFSMLGICKEGGLRLYDKDGIAQMMMVSPHPANGIVTFTFETIEKGATKLMLTDALGQQIVLKEGNFEKGSHLFEFDTKSLTSGLYILTMQTPTQVFTQQVIINR